MANRSKAKGTAFESAVVKYLRGELGDNRIERLALHGSKDMGDIGHLFAHGSEGIIECKAHKRPTRSLVSEWREQTIDERENSDSDFALLVIKNPQHPVSESLTHVTLRDLARIAMFVHVASAFCDLADDEWVTMTLEDATRLIRGD